MGNTLGAAAKKGCAGWDVRWVWDRHCFFGGGTGALGGWRAGLRGLNRWGARHGVWCATREGRRGLGSKKRGSLLWWSAHFRGSLAARGLSVCLSLLRSAPRGALWAGSVARKAGWGVSVGLLAAVGLGQAKQAWAREAAAAAAAREPRRARAHTAPCASTASPTLRNAGEREGGGDGGAVGRWIGVASMGGPAHARGPAGRGRDPARLITRQAGQGSRQQAALYLTHCIHLKGRITHPQCWRPRPGWCCIRWQRPWRCCEASGRWQKVRPGEQVLVGWCYSVAASLEVLRSMGGGKEG